MSQVTLLARADISQVKKNRNCFSFGALRGWCLCLLGSTLFPQWSSYPKQLDYKIPKPKIVFPFCNLRCNVASGVPRIHIRYISFRKVAPANLHPHVITRPMSSFGRNNVDCCPIRQTLSWTAPHWYRKIFWYPISLTYSSEQGAKAVREGNLALNWKEWKEAIRKVNVLFFTPNLPFTRHF